MPLLLGIDPGEKKSALALCVGGEGDKADIELIHSNRISNQELGEFIERWVDSPKGSLYVAYEQYLVYKSKLQAHMYSHVNTVEAIGIIEYVCKKHKIPVVSFRASDWKQATTTTFRQRYNFWPSTNAQDNPHVRDAAGIALYAFRHQGIFNNGKRVLTKVDQEILHE